MSIDDEEKELADFLRTNNSTCQSRLALFHRN